MESLSPFLWGSCIPYNMPVYPGAQRKIANALIELVQAQPRHSRVTGHPEVILGLREQSSSLTELPIPSWPNGFADKPANRNVWSAALLQAKSESDRWVCANVFGL